MWRRSKERGLGVWIWAKSDPIWAKWDPIWAKSVKNGQKCCVRIGQSSYQWMIERLSKSMGSALVGNNFLPIPSKISFYIKKSDSSQPEIYKALKSCWLLIWVSIARVVASFPQASRSRPAGTAADFETPCVCACPSDPRKPSITFWTSLQRDCQMTCRGSNLDSNLNCAAWPTSCKGFIASKITA